MKLRKYLSQPGLLSAVHRSFRHIPDPLGKSNTINLSDCLMSGLTLFSLKYPSLLQFDKGRDDEVVRHNLNSLYGISHVPCDTYLGERLDEVDPAQLRPVFKQLFAQVQRGNEL